MFIQRTCSVGRAQRFLRRLNLHPTEAERIRRQIREANNYDNNVYIFAADRRGAGLAIGHDAYSPVKSGTELGQVLRDAGSGRVSDYFLCDLVYSGGGNADPGSHFLLRSLMGYSRKKGFNKVFTMQEIGTPGI
ncbi:hypothetical protein KY328_00160, partial [Candidatus Woesearchaeota archaeon]|nr:hypothetical protein [Candidatus Woesearchaeota archaeon]